MWYLYIITCSDNSLYTGITTDITRRLKEHNRGKGGNYTRSRGPVKLSFQETCSSRSKALKREFEIKGLCRKEKLYLLKKNLNFEV